MVPTTEQALARVVEHITSRNPVLLSRIGKAHQLVQAGAVAWSPDIRAHVVRSQSNELGAYTVSLADKSCTCPDQPRAPHGWCKHLLAVAVVGMADEYQARRAAASAVSREAREWRRLVRSYLVQRAAAVAEVA
jgi:uncharacterized Zn finger protein